MLRLSLIAWRNEASISSILHWKSEKIIMFRSKHSFHDINDSFKAKTFDERFDLHKQITKATLIERGYNVEAILSRPDTRKPYWKKGWFYGKNLVGTDGDIYYAKKGAGETPTTNENFIGGRIEFRTGAATPAKADTYSAVTTPVTTSRKVVSATYPKTNDTGDADNTGDAVDAVSYKFDHTTTDFNATAIIGGCVHDNAAPVAATKLLTHFSIALLDKTSTDTLKFFINHAVEGI